MKNGHTCSRRHFVKKTSTGLAALAGGMAVAACSQNSTSPNDKDDNQKLQVGSGDAGLPNARPGYSADVLPRRPLGKTGMDVSVLSFGGGSQFMANPDGQWEPLLERALELGINYFDTAESYGGSEARYSEILTPIREQVYITSKFNGGANENNRQNPDYMKSELDQILKNLKTDYLDVFMMHAINDNDSLTKVGQFYDEMVKLKEQGIVKNIGFSSMNSASKSRDLIKTFDFDVCMLAINPTTYGNYETVTMPEAIKKGMGVFAMKVMRDVVGKNGVTPADLMDWALDREGVSGAVIGHVGQNILNQNAELAMKYAPSSVPRDWSHLENRLKPFAGPHALCWANPNYRDEVRTA
jgi:predicted aldo/keto reductase-like oxidoreductase